MSTVIHAGGHGLVDLGGGDHDPELFVVKFDDILHFSYGYLCKNNYLPARNERFRQK